MRVNGNYFDRLLVSILPLIFVIGGIIYLIEPSKSIIIAFLLTGLAYWILDTIIFLFKQPKNLKICDARLQIGKQFIRLDDIKEITPITDQRFRWSFELVKINFCDGSEVLIIDKPSPFWYLGDKSKSVELLISHFPDLQTKVKERLTT